MERKWRLQGISKGWMVLLGAIVLLLSADARAQRDTVPGMAMRTDSIQTLGEGRGVNWTQGIIFAEGFGVVQGDQAPTKGQRKLMARRAALNDAYRNLAETVDGVQVAGETTVRDMAVARDVVRTQVNALIRGARTVKTEYEEDEGAITAMVTIEAPLSGAGGLANVVLPFVKEQVIDNTKPKAIEVILAPAAKQYTVKETMKDYVPPEDEAGRDDEPDQDQDEDKDQDKDEDQPKPAPKPVEVVQHDRPVEITGVVFDTSKTAYSWNMFPRVMAEDDRTIFDISVSEKWVQAGSFTPFQETVEDGRRNPRVAKDPIVIRARKIDGMTIYISNEDANRILAANNEYDVLIEGKVLFVIKQ